MSIDIRWTNSQKTSLALTLTAPWSWNEFEHLSPQIAQAFSSVTHEVDLVIDMTQVGQIPESSLAHLRDAYSDDTENLGQYIFINAPQSFKTLFAAADRYYTVLGGHLDFTFIETELSQAL